MKALFSAVETEALMKSSCCLRPILMGEKSTLTLFGSSTGSGSEHHNQLEGSRKLQLLAPSVSGPVRPGLS